MSLEFIVFGTFWAPCTCISVSFPSLGKILATIFQIIFLFFSLFLPFGNAVPKMQASFQRPLSLSSLLNIFILLLCLGEFSCFVPQSLIHFSTSSNLLLNHSSVFFSFVSTSLWYFLYFLSLLKLSLCLSILILSSGRNFMTS